MRAQKIVRRQWQARGETHTLDEVLSDVRDALNHMEDEAQIGAALEGLCAAAHLMDLDAETALRSAIARRIDNLRRDGQKT